MDVGQVREIEQVVADQQVVRVVVRVAVEAAPARVIEPVRSGMSVGSALAGSPIQIQIQRWRSTTGKTRTRHWPGRCPGTARRCTCRRGRTAGRDRGSAPCRLRAGRATGARRDGSTCPRRPRPCPPGRATAPAAGQNRARQKPSCGTSLLHPATYQVFLMNMVSSRSGTGASLRFVR